MTMMMTEGDEEEISKITAEKMSLVVAPYELMGIMSSCRGLVRAKTVKLTHHARGELY